MVPPVFDFFSVVPPRGTELGVGQGEAAEAASDDRRRLLRLKLLQLLREVLLEKTQHIAVGDFLIPLALFLLVLALLAACLLLGSFDR